FFPFSLPNHDQRNGERWRKPNGAPSHRLVRFGKTFRNDSDPCPAFNITQDGTDKARAVSDPGCKARCATSPQDFVVQASSFSPGQHDQSLRRETAPWHLFPSRPRMV